MDLDLIAVAGVACSFVTIIAAAATVEKDYHRSVWVKPWIIQRPVCGAYHKLISDLLNTDEASFRNFVRMDVPAFEELLSRVEFRLTKARTRLRHPIGARERLCVVVRYLATGKWICGNVNASEML